MSKYGGYDVLPHLADLYDLNPAYMRRKDVDFYVSYAQTVDGPTLELGCGTGRVLVPVAETGCSIVGLDFSEYMLANCREKLNHACVDVQSRVRIVHANMKDFELGDTFGLVTTPFRSFQHLVTVEEQLACLRCVNRHLRTGGILILDLFHPNLSYLCDPDCHVEKEECSGVELSNGRTLRRTHRVAAHHRAEQYMDVEIIFYVTHPDGREERVVQAFPFRYFFRYEVEHLLDRCGFAVVDLFGNFDKSAFGDDSPEMIFVAEKARDLRA